MRIHALPKVVEAVLFDIDGTLYNDPAYQEFQNHILIEELARVRGVSPASIRDDLESFREAYAKSNGGAKTSLGNAMAGLGVSIETSVAWRERLIHPSLWLKPDPRLAKTLGVLRASGLALAAVTNNPRSVGEAGLDALGVAAHFGLPEFVYGVVGLDDTWKSKPAREPYELAARKLGVAADRCISVGDRFDVDLAVPLEIGMGGILVDGVSDVYGLAAIIIARG